MNAPELTDAQIDVLAEQIDAQFRELNRASDGVVRGDVQRNLPDKQRKAIEAATGEDAATFWRRFKAAARKDLCEEGGRLYAQWQRWRDLSTKDVVKVFSGVLAGMGFSGNFLSGTVVATGAIVLHIVLNIGIQAICDEGDRPCEN